MFNFLNNKKVEIEKEIILLNAKRDSVKQLLDLEKEIRGLKDTIAAAKTQHIEENKRLKHDRKIADEDIKHMVKMKEERLGLDHKKKALDCDREKDKEIAKVKDSYRDKMEKRLQNEVDQTKAMYSEILQRLPNINVNMKGKV
jgi:hypothetical protein